MMDLLKRNILSVFEEDDTEERKKTINKLLAQKQKELVSMTQAKKAYSALADEVVEVVCGIPIMVKTQPFQSAF